MGEGVSVCAVLEGLAGDTTTMRKFFYKFNSIVHTKAASSSFHRLLYQLYRAHHRLVERKTATHQFHSEEDSMTQTSTTIEFERAKFAINKKCSPSSRVVRETSRRKAPAFKVRDEKNFRLRSTAAAADVDL